MPGHMHAAIKAMEARYLRRAREEDPNVAAEMLLSDPLDASEYVEKLLLIKYQSFPYTTPGALLQKSMLFKRDFMNSASGNSVLREI